MGVVKGVRVARTGLLVWVSYLFLEECQNEVRFYMYFSITYLKFKAYKLSGGHWIYSHL